MPNRILREGINDSEKINALSEAAELFYRKLMSLVDDFGRFEANTRVLWGRLYALRPNRTPEDVDKLLAECCQPVDGEPPLIVIYHVDGKRYLQINNFEQRTRSESKYPAPPEEMSRVSGPGEQPGWVYFVRSASTGKIKIGFTVSTPDARVSALQTGSSDKLEILLTIKALRKTESQLHRRFAAFRQNGEWFEASSELMAFVEEEAARKCAQMEATPASRARSTPNTNTNTTSKERGLGETAGDDYEPTSDESQEFDSWAQAAYARHPKKSKKFLAEQSLMRRFCRDPAARERFDRNHELWCETQAWREKSGAFCPPLHEFVADDAWEYPPTQPSQQSQGRGTMQDLFG